MAGIYVHIPFCKQACHYCDFHFSTNLELKDALIDAIVQEVALQNDYLDQERVETIYFGGGTPSLLTQNDLEKILGAIVKTFPVEKSCEITLEANPDDLTSASIGAMLAVGVNRLSIGVQSFHEDTLKMLHRAHSADQALTAVTLAQQMGITNINIDLIHSIPGQHNSILTQNIEVLLRLKPTHVSAYSLTIEQKTAFGKWAKNKKFVPMSEDESAVQFNLVMDALLEAGFEHYEISNFALPGFYSKHNTSYWQQKKYLGIGPSAHSFDLETRQFNIANNARYIKSIKQGIVPFEREVLTADQRANEYLFTTLRTQWGTPLVAIQQMISSTQQQKFEQTVKQLVTKKLVELRNENILLTREGKLMADYVASELFV